MLPISLTPRRPRREPLGLKGTISSGFYLRGDIGVGVQSIGKYHQDDVVQFGGAFFGKTDNAAFFAGLGVGYRFNNWLRFDVTGEYRGAASDRRERHRLQPASTTATRPTPTRAT